MFFFRSSSDFVLHRLALTRDRSNRKICIIRFVREKITRRSNGKYDGGERGNRYLQFPAHSVARDWFYAFFLRSVYRSVLRCCSSIARTQPGLDRSTPRLCLQITGSTRGLSPALESRRNAPPSSRGIWAPGDAITSENCNVAETQHYGVGRYGMVTSAGIEISRSRDRCVLDS